MTSVDALRPGMTGVWVVHTQGSSHVFDLDRMTWRRIPSPSSGFGPQPTDGVEHTITEMRFWPRVGSLFVLWIDDCDSGVTKERWHRSSRIRLIERRDAAAADGGPEQWSDA